MRYRAVIFWMLSAGFAGAQSFNLWIPQEQVPVLKNRAESGEFRTEWSNYLAKADQLCDPLSENYADPDGVTEGGEDGQGHVVARRLIYWMEFLGTAYRLTGDTKYCSHGIVLLTNCAQQLTLSSACMAQAYYGAYGDMMRGLATGYDFFAADMTELQRAQVLQTSGAYLEDFIRTANQSGAWWQPYHNYMGVCGGGAGLVALQLRDTYPDEAGIALQHVLLQIKKWLDSGFDAQGAYYEGVLYSTYGLENVFLFADILKRTGGEDLFQNSSLQNVINFYVQSVLPGEKTMDARNDSLYDRSPGPFLLKIASEYNNGTAKWLYKIRLPVTGYKTWGAGLSFFLQLLWANDVNPVSPEAAGMPLAEYFQGRGLCTWRTGWMSDDVMFSVEAGKYYIVTHNQADKGHFTLYGYGYRWACDSGYANNNDPLGRAQTSAHNCVLIDGQGQARSGAGLGTSGRILSYTNTATYGYALADCSDAYRRYYSFNGDRVNYPDGVPHESMTLDHAYRHTLFIRKTSTTPAYAVVLDDIDKDGAVHDYRWQMLSWPDLDVKPGTNSAVIVPVTNNPTALGMQVFFDAAADMSVTNDLCTPADTNISPSIFPRLNATCHAVNPYFAAVLAPLAGIAPPEVRFEETSSRKTVFIAWPEKTDRIVWNKTGGEPLGSVQFFRPGADGFDRTDTLMGSDGQTIGDEWCNSRADAKWGIIDGRITADAGTGYAALYNTSLKTVSGNGTNFTLSAELLPRENIHWAGLVWNYQNSTNCYFLQMKAGTNTYQIYRMVNGVMTRLGASGTASGVFAAESVYTVTVTSAEAYNFDIEIKDTASGTVLVSASRTDDAASFAGGYAGLLQVTGGADRFRFDNFSLNVSRSERAQPAGTDDFNRANTSMSSDGNVIGTYWNNSQPDAKWGLADGQLVVSAGTNTTVLYNTALETVSGNGAGFTLRTDVIGLYNGVWAGPVWNYQNSTNYYFLQMKMGSYSNYQVYAVVNGSKSTVMTAGAPVTFATGTVYTVTVISSEAHHFGIEIKEAVSGTVIASRTATDTHAFFTGGYAGMQYFNSINRARFDNFSLQRNDRSGTGLLFLLKGMP